MKIGFVLDDSLDKTDGVQQYVLTLGEWFSAQGHEVHYLVGDSRRRDIKNIHSLARNLRVQFNQNRMSTPLPVSRRKVKALLDKEQFDVLHVQMPYSPFLAARVILSASPSTAVIGTFHILPFSKIESMATKLLAHWLWRSRRRFDQVFSVSRPAADFAKSHFGVTSQVLPNAVDVSKFKTVKTFKKYADGKINIVYLGRLVERKGCMHLLKALALLNKNQSLLNVRVIIAGKGPLLEELKSFASKHQLSKVVDFTGFVSEEEKPRLLASANIAVMPSTGGESFGIVLVEAMAAGSEVVLAGDNMGYRTVMDGREKQLIDPKNTQQFAERLSHFISSAAVRHQAKKWQLERIKDFDVSLIGERLLKNYTKVLRNKSSVR